MQFLKLLVPKIFCENVALVHDAAVFKMLAEEYHNERGEANMSH